MDLNYILGVAAAIICGIVNNIGVLLQKKTVSELPPEFRGRGFMLRLLKNPVWLLGLFLQLGLGAAAFMIAQALIGPALVPGLMAAGLVVLAIGSVKLIGETVSPSEYFGIFSIVIGTALLGFSQLSISVEVVRDSLALTDIVIRIAIFTAGLFVLCGITHLVSLKSSGRKGVIMGFSNGFLYALSNFWVSPLLAVITVVLAGKGTSGQIFIFVLASAILVGTNVAAIRQIQEAFKFGQASNIIPVQQIPIQTAPILVYFFAFALKPPGRASVAFIVIGVLFIIAGGFLLGRRQSELEKIQ